MGYFRNAAVWVPTFTIADVAGVTFGGFLCDKYINSQPNATALEGSADVAHSGSAGTVPGISQLGRPVWDYITVAQAMIACCNKGKGWHLMSAFEWASLAFLAKKLGTMPHGANSNVDPPTDNTYTTEIGMLDLHAHGESGSVHRALPGTGPNIWSHNRQASGVFDLNGIVSEWIIMFMTSAGYPRVPGNLSVTYTGSPYGRGTITGSGGASPTLTCDGAGVNWLKSWTADEFNGMYLFVAETGSMYTIADTTATTIVLAGGSAPGNIAATFAVVKTVSTDITNGMTTGHRVLTLRDADADLKAFALPATADVTGSATYGYDMYVFATGSERAVYRGGAYNSNTGAGVFSIAIDKQTDGVGLNVGFRACKAL